MKTCIDIALEYVYAINSANVSDLYSLMGEDYIFTDAHDNKVFGRDNMKQSWIDYFTMFPDYKIEVDDVLQKGNLICIIGYASGTYKGLMDEENSNYWRIPAVWTAFISNNHVEKWQVYADNIIVMDIIKSNS